MHGAVDAHVRYTVIVGEIRLKIFSQTNILLIAAGNVACSCDRRSKNCTLHIYTSHQRFKSENQKKKYMYIYNSFDPLIQDFDLFVRADIKFKL